LRLFKRLRVRSRLLSRFEWLAAYCRTLFWKSWSMDIEELERRTLFVERSRARLERFDDCIRWRRPWRWTK